MIEEKAALKLGERLFKLRDFTPLPLIFILFVVASPTIITATVGTVVVLLGEFFRIYSVAFIGPISRTRKGSLGDQLVTNGPFAWVRNPLYFGNFLILLGISLYGGVFWFVLLAAAACCAQYYLIEKYESTLLIKKFGTEYLEYKSKVPAWLPRKLPSLDKVEWPATYTIALKSEKNTLVSITVTLFILMLSA